MKEKIYRTVLSVAAVVAAVLAFRWTVRTVVTRAYTSGRDVSPREVQVVPAQKVWSLAEIVPRELHVNLAGLAVQRRAERLGMPYSLAVDVAEQKAKSAGWERMDDENALTFKTLSGMESVYKTPEGSIVLREVRPIMGDDSLMEDYIIPAEMVPTQGEAATPDILARRSAQLVKAKIPEPMRDVVVGSPLMTELVKRGSGAAFIVHSVAEKSAAAAEKEIETAALRTGWSKTQYADLPDDAAAHDGGVGRNSVAMKAGWTKQNLTMQFEAVQRPGLFECDVNYRFTDDESYVYSKGKTNDED